MCVDVRVAHSRCRTVLPLANWPTSFMAGSTATVAIPRTAVVERTAVNWLARRLWQRLAWWRQKLVTVLHLPQRGPRPLPHVELVVILSEALKLAQEAQLLEFDRSLRTG